MNEADLILPEPCPILPEAGGMSELRDLKLALIQA
jgi:hypothetical protein